MTKRRLGSEQTREALDGLLEGCPRDQNAKSDLVKLATRLIIEEGLEVEIRNALGRGYYEHGREPGRVHRNGVREARMKTAEGFIVYSALQVTTPRRRSVRQGGSSPVLMLD
jgi:putative transposase